MRRRTDRILAYLAFVLGLTAALLIVVEMVFLLLWVLG